MPRLRKFPFDIGSISFVGRIHPRRGRDYRTGKGFDGGLDGYNWRIRIPNHGTTYVLKLFWDTEPWYPHYFAPQRECQNAALLQSMEAAVSDAARADNPNGPILVIPDPQCRQEAQANLLAFSNEARQKNIGVQSHDLLSITSIPRMRKCYGWLQFTGEELRRRLPRKLAPPPIEVDKVVRSIHDEKLYTAVVYEFIEEAENDVDVVKTVLEFLWRAGFSHHSPKADNWKGSVLVDLSDIENARTYGWCSRNFGITKPKKILRS
ncbi:hypothetical protein J3459_016581 [Metarhizium acridum]|nr:hypothetical protein J3459_016581 [Metarhizium acridum]